MKYVVQSSKPVDKAVEDLERAVAAHGFGVLYIHDLRATLAGKGLELSGECRVLEVCNPQQALDVLNEDMEMNMVLPCRISVFEDRGETRIGMIRPTTLLASLSESPKLMDVAEEVEQKTIAMIEDAR